MNQLSPNLAITACSLSRAMSVGLMAACLTGCTNQPMPMVESKDAKLSFAGKRVWSRGHVQLELEANDEYIVRARDWWELGDRQGEPSCKGAFILISWKAVNATTGEPALVGLLHGRKTSGPEGATFHDADGAAKVGYCETLQITNSHAYSAKVRIDFASGADFFVYTE